MALTAFDRGVKMSANGDRLAGHNLVKSVHVDAPSAGTLTMSVTNGAGTAIGIIGDPTAVAISAGQNVIAEFGDGQWLYNLTLTTISGANNEVVVFLA